MRFRGSFVPLITPFDRKGRLDTKALEQLIEWHISEGTDGIVCSATTGEGPSLSDSERKKIGEISVRTSAKRIPIIVSTGINDTRTSIRYTESAQKLGADGCLVVTPYYNKPSQEGCLLHFKEIAKVGLPVIAYHNPPRCAIRLHFETILELSRIPNVAAIKESSHDLDLIEKIAGRIDVFAGDDDIALEIRTRGGVGTIATSANVIPRRWKTMVDFCRQRKWKEAERLNARHQPLFKALFLETNPQPVKFALSWLGKCTLALRLPLIPPKQKTEAAVKEAIVSLALPQFTLPIPSETSLL